MYVNKKKRTDPKKLLETCAVHQEEPPALPGDDAGQRGGRGPRSQRGRSPEEEDGGRFKRDGNSAGTREQTGSGEPEDEQTPADTGDSPDHRPASTGVRS